MGLARHHEPAWNLRFMRGFRMGVIGLALIATGAAWIWQLGWLLVLALVIGGEETLESSIDAWAVRRGMRLRRARETAATRSTSTASRR